MPSSRIRRNFAWVPGAISAISSRKIVPSCASSKQPGRRSSAPVKAPFSWPKISLSSSVSGMAAQFTATNGPGRARTSSCRVSRDQLLARAALAGDQHRRGRRGRHLDQAIDRLHGRAGSHQLPDAPDLLDPLAQQRDFAHGLRPLDRLRHQRLQPGDVDRLGQEVVGAFLHRGHGGVHASLPAQQDHASRTAAPPGARGAARGRPAWASRDR